MNMITGHEANTLVDVDKFTEITFEDENEVATFGLHAVVTLGDGRSVDLLPLLRAASEYARIAIEEESS